MSSFSPKIEIGQIVDNERIVNEFGCSPQGGMRRSHKTNTLVLISNHVPSRGKVYDDKQVGDTYHYTGMGMNGNQDISFAQNKTLAESKDSGVRVYFFEVFKPREYTFMGEVSLSGKPYTEGQTDESGRLRRVWMFPLRLMSNNDPRSIIDEKILEDVFEEQVKIAKELTTEELYSLAIRSGSTKTNARRTKSITYTRNPYIAEYAKRRAKGRCQLCEKPAPFLDLRGSPYLESHHILWLSKGGPDIVENTVALCPNCHKCVHVRNDKENINKLALANHQTKSYKNIV